MAVVDHFDWANRRIYMAVAVWHPIDVYHEYREERRTNEAARPYNPLLRYEGYVAKGGGKFTPRYMVMLGGAKIVPVDGLNEPITTITGEIITDDQTEFIDVTPLTSRPLVKYQPPEAEVIEVVSSGNEYSLAEISDAVFAGNIEGSLNFKSVLRLAVAVLLGKVSGADTNQPVFRNPADTKDRVAAVTDDYGNRSQVVLDAGD